MVPFPYFESSRPFPENPNPILIYPIHRPPLRRPLDLVGFPIWAKASVSIDIAVFRGKAPILLDEERGFRGEMEDGNVSVGVDAVGKPQSSGKNKDRHIVSWTPQEDDLLREQVGIHGTENSWTCIAAQFKDKTSRQCRRRWYTYLNTECKKGGWSQEEDIILCEAQKIFGNRWTEISKVVSGRTDNAVKNRFNTLCKKRAKNEVLSNENGHTLFNMGNGSNPLLDGSDGDVASEQQIKKIRFGSSEAKENHCENESLHVQSGKQRELSRPPLAMHTQNIKNVTCLLSSRLSDKHAEASICDELKNMSQDTFLKKDDPKVTALMQQAELLTTLAQKVNADNSNQCLEDAWKELRNYLIQMGECGPTCSEQSEINSLLGDLNELEDLSSYTENERSLIVRKKISRQLDPAENSQGTHEYNVRAVCHIEAADIKEDQDATCLLRDNDASVCSDDAGATRSLVQVCRPSEEGKRNDASTISLPTSELKENDGNLATLPISEFNSPLQTVPLFRSFTEVIPSPKFSASERQFLLSILGLTSPSSNTANSNPSQPSCKRALLHSL